MRRVRQNEKKGQPRAKGTPYGRMTIVTAGKKQGGGYLFTEKELAAWDMALAGYLREYEAAYPGPAAPPTHYSQVE